MTEDNGSRRVYVTGSRPDVRVPVREVSLSPLPGRSEPAGPPVRLYETQGLHGEPSVADA